MSPEVRRKVDEWINEHWDKTVGAVDNSLIKFIEGLLSEKETANADRPE